MPVAEYGYSRRPIIDKRRDELIKKWRALGCTESKIQKLIMRRMHSKRQWW